MPDLTDQNQNTIQALLLHNMSLEEMIAADRRVESRFHNSGGIWWREVKPFFHQPANFLTPVWPGRARPNPFRALGGYYHRVPEGAPYNGAIVTNEVSTPSAWSLADVRKTKRQLIRKGLSALCVRPVTDLKDLLTDGYQVYLDWEQRTGDVRVKRTAQDAFTTWISRNFDHPGELILGAYLDSRLVAYIMVRCVEGTADVAKAFSHSDYHAIEPTSTLLYAYITICGQTPGVEKACDGLRSLKPSLEHYKAGLGFQHVSYPAHIHLPAVLRPIVKRSMPKEYKRLMGDYGDAPEQQIQRAS